MAMVSKFFIFSKFSCLLIHNLLYHFINILIFFFFTTVLVECIENNDCEKGMCKFPFIVRCLMDQCKCVRIHNLI
ncbi:Nodule Cysteine-Rich (NCR) secreted peptide [Medicago truncatula]|uniref:Nodule Cysteine-Rich (NCR) secreted peptide n=1 Tax=Medicago truncatula TaxID=3880 RepID=A0A072UG77_MEDTR|nr:Nodule Cysteine-Rich (NCR) secreted peptide [Medicago truncatula]